MDRFSWLNPLSSLPTGWTLIAWSAILAVPPLIVMLYFLKLKRLPLQVPSTYLWHKSIEDLHVNSIWQRLRQSLLLFLQLLLLALLLFALLGPAWRSQALQGNRFIFMVDNSASMQAEDVEPSRLGKAKEQANALIDQMRGGDVAMVVSFSDAARVEQTFTDNRKLLRQRVAQIEPADRTTSLAEALKVAAGLANPGQSSFGGDQDTPVATAQPATLYIFSDGGFADVQGFYEGNLTPVYLPIGDDEAANVGIMALSTRRHDDEAGKIQAFARIENFGRAPVAVTAELSFDGRFLDAQQLTLPPGEGKGVTFDLEDLDSGMLQLTLTPGEGGWQDALAADNVAWTPLNKPRKAKVLLLSSGNEPLEFALSTGRTAEVAETTVRGPDFVTTSDYKQLTDSGAFNLVIFDRCLPPGQPKPVLPRANTFFINTVPPVEGWNGGEKTAVPLILDTDRSHPLMQLVEMGDVLIADGTPLTFPAGGRSLIDSRSGSLLAIAPREGFEDLAMGFELIGADNTLGTNWHVRLSFPLFVLNLVQYLGQGQDALSTGSVQPGHPVTLRTETPVDKLTVVTPAERTVEVPRGRGEQFYFNDTDRLGPYHVRQGEQTLESFAVNLFDGTESNLRPRPALNLGPSTVEGVAEGVRPARREAWKLLVLLGLAVLLFEWYIYNRRIYL